MPHMDDDVPAEIVEAFGQAIEAMSWYLGQQTDHGGTTFMRLEGGTARAAAQDA